MLEDRYNNMAAGGSVTNQAASVTSANADSGAALDIPAQSTRVFVANASPSVNDELEAKCAEMEQPSPGKAAPGTPIEQGASAQGSPVQCAAAERMTMPAQISVNWDEEESERQDAETAAGALSEDPEAEGVSSARDIPPAQERGIVQSTNDDLEAKFAEMEARSRQNTSSSKPNVDGRGKA